MRALDKPESVNLIFLTGRVVKKKLSSGRNGTTVCKVRLMMLTPLGRFPKTYVEVLATGDKALALDLCSQKGNLLYVEGRFGNCPHLAKGGKQWLEVIVYADEFRVLLRDEKAFLDNDSKSIVRILAGFDPEGYLEGKNR